MSPKKSTSKAKPKKFFIKDKEEITDANAPVVSDEFEIADAPEGELAQGQTVTVSADTKFSDDLGTGETIIVRSFQFAANPEVFMQYKEAYGTLPNPQDIFDSHKQGIEAMLWSDGLAPAEQVEPKVIFSKDETTYLIVVGATPMAGQAVAETPQTLSEIFNGSNRQTPLPKDSV